MPESFSEDIIDGELIDISEREGGWFQNILKKVSNTIVNAVSPKANPIVNTVNDMSRQMREAAEATERAIAAAEQARRDAAARAEQAKRDEAARLAAIEAERIRNEETKKTLANTYNQTMIQYQQLVAKGQYIQVQISEHQYKIIPPLNAQIKILTDENTRLRTKEKSLNDNTTFFKNIVSGRDEKDGYKQTIVKNQQDIESTIFKEININTEENIDSADIYTEGLTGDKDEDILNVNESSEKFRFFKPRSYRPIKFNMPTQGAIPIVINTDTPLKEVEIVYKSSDIKQKIIELNEYLARANAKVNIEKTKVAGLELALSKLQELVEKKRAHIVRLTRDNKQLKIKNNYTLDDLQYNRSLVFGNNKVDGYKDIEIKQHDIKTTLENQPIGTPIDLVFSNDKDSHEQEGFINESAAGYNNVFTQNRALENQITNVKNTHSVDNQLAVNLIKRKQFVQLINKILIFIFIIAFAYSCFKVYTLPNIDKYTKIAIILLMFSTIFIIHSIEYILLHVVPYFSALILGTPYNPKTYWNKPGIYDYLPTLE